MATRASTQSPAVVSAVIIADQLAIDQANSPDKPPASHQVHCCCVDLYSSLYSEAMRIGNAGTIPVLGDHRVLGL